jgi:hypothetical protein
MAADSGDDGAAAGAATMEGGSGNGNNMRTAGLAARRAVERLEPM